MLSEELAKELGECADERFGYADVEDPRNVTLDAVWDLREVAFQLIHAGWRKQQTVSTVSELNALPTGSVLRFKGGQVATASDDWYEGERKFWGTTDGRDLPAVVLYVPGDGE